MDQKNQQNNNENNSGSELSGRNSDFVSAPSITLPKGGGAIRGIGEKFAANPVTGTGSLTIPIATSPGRGGFSPQLSLSYDSGAGNGPFGLGWNLSTPSISRKTDKGLPRYWDAKESDEFILSGSEDLVPVLVHNNDQWEREELPCRTVAGKAYRIQRYLPRIEGLFARIERWTNQSDTSDSFWRSISTDNIITWYGKTEESRIADPSNPTQIFSWLICENYDDKGNVIVYGYEKENSINVDVSQANEKNRSEDSRSANRYLKHIRYSNHTPYFPELLETTHWPQPPGATAADVSTDWYFEVVFDYGEHDLDHPRTNDSGDWNLRHDPFSTYRSGFELRTYRLCQRVLMFHHFPNETVIGADCLVRSTDFNYRYEQQPEDPRNPIHTVLTSVTQCGYKKQADGSYLKKTMPPVEFNYSQAILGTEIKKVNSASLENLPYGVDGSNYQWLDLDGEGLSGVLTEQGSGWFYKYNESPITQSVENGIAHYEARLSSVQSVPSMPSGGLSGVSNRQFMDLAGDGQLDLVELDRPTAGFYERTHEKDWQTFRQFQKVPNIDWNDPNLKFIDLTGDGHADVLITEHDALTWYESLAEAGFDAAERTTIPTDEEQGPRVVFADAAQTIFQADLSGDGLTDIVRIRNGEVCYWPNLGYGHFGAKVTMDDAPWFDSPDQFDPRRIRLADIDGSGVTDIIYLGRNQTQIRYNQSGNRWSAVQTLECFPPVDNIASVAAVDLLGNGTACLVWSTPVPGESHTPMRYLELMAEGKPHLMIATRNNLGAETRVRYVPSTYFYLKDKQAGKPWVTPLPFPVHVVERVETYDHISRNRFVTRSAYHHGFFDGVEREFRGFGMVEQWDTEDFAALSESAEFPTGENIDETSHIPPVLTRTWFHTGVYLGRNHVSDFFAGLLDDRDVGEYYREPGLMEMDAEARDLLLADTVLPTDLTLEEEREACRTLKGSMLRQEVYALDGTDKAEHPYSVTEQNFTIHSVQPKAGNNHAVFFTHARESISYQYERNPTDPRIAQALTLEVDEFGNVQKEAAIAYGRREKIHHVDEQGEVTLIPNPALAELAPDDQAKQTQILITYTENRVTNAIDANDAYRTPLPCETRTYELTDYTPTGPAGRFQDSDLVQMAGNSLEHIFDSELNYEDDPGNGKQRRLIEQLRTLYRPDDFGNSQNDPLALLPLATMEFLALPGETYKLAFTPGLLNHVYQRTPAGQPQENLLPDPTNILGGLGGDQGGYVDLDANGHWWIPSGRIFYSENAGDTAVQERQQARQHFFLPRKFLDPFAQVSTVHLDDYDLLTLETRDPLDNRVTVGERDAIGNITTQGNDYRVLQPKRMMDPNRNRSAVAFDALGMVVGTAVMGKPGENLGDSLDGFVADLSEAVILDHLANPLTDPHAILGRAATRLVYDLFAYQRSKDQPDPQPAVVYSLARETHDTDLEPGQQTRIQHSFNYSDGFGREIQNKIQAEPEPVPRRDVTGTIIVDADGQPEMTANDVSPRWVGSGWTVFNNKGKPVRQYEPFFTDTHRFEFDVRIGVSPVIFYDPAERVVATLHPNHSWEKVVFNPWRQESWDVNDTVTQADPKDDPDVGDFFRRLPDADYLPTWYAQRQDGALGPREQNAANKAAAHADTPAVAYLDTLGRTFLTIADNGSQGQYLTRLELDIEGNTRWITDARGNRVMEYAYNMVGPEEGEDEEESEEEDKPDDHLIYQNSMDAGELWMLYNVVGNQIRSWDSRNHVFSYTYDELQRQTHFYVQTENVLEFLAEQIVYGESYIDQDPAALNLRGQVYQQYDGAGVVTNVGFDFKDNVLETNRKLATDYTSTPDWSQSPGLESETFTTLTSYDALNRPVAITTPDKSIYQPIYNEANLLNAVNVNLRGAETQTAFVTNIDYDAKGQREKIEYANGVVTTYTYDPFTFRLTGLNTISTSNNTILQNLSYTYDPVGNIMAIHDDAQQTHFFNNSKVEPHNRYEYDALYRLIKADGREHAGQGANNQRNHNDFPYMNIPNTNDGQAMRSYSEEFNYDEVGNIMSMVHRLGRLPNPGQVLWNRRYNYATGSNRLLSTSRPGDADVPKYSDIDTYSDVYDYDGHGNMTSMPHLTSMQWDYDDQLQATTRQVVNNGSEPETTWYTYDADGQRVRKVTEHQTAGNDTSIRLKERIYLDGFEIYRDYESDGIRIKLERETLHIMDDEKRIAMVETKIDANTTPISLTRYQINNHLGSSSLELDENGFVISYEEYYPYGNTSYHAAKSGVDVSLKRYRYTGMERDEESGLEYHGARYYLPWLGRWLSADPLGIKDGLNIFCFVRNNPLNLVDSNGTTAKNNAYTWGTRNPKLNYPNTINKTGTERISIMKKILKSIIKDSNSCVGGRRCYYCVTRSLPLLRAFTGDDSIEGSDYSKTIKNLQSSGNAPLKANLLVEILKVEWKRRGRSMSQSYKASIIKKNSTPAQLTTSVNAIKIFLHKHENKVIYLNIASGYHTTVMMYDASKRQYLLFEGKANNWIGFNVAKYFRSKISKYINNTYTPGVPVNLTLEFAAIRMVPDWAKNQGVAIPDYKPSPPKILGGERKRLRDISRQGEVKSIHAPTPSVHSRTYL